MNVVNVKGHYGGENGFSRFSVILLEKSDACDESFLRGVTENDAKKKKIYISLRQRI